MNSMFMPGRKRKRVVRGMATTSRRIEGALRGGLEAPIELMFSVRERRELFALETLAALARRFANFTYRITITREDSELPNFLRGRCTALLEREQPKLGGMRILIAGPPGFVDDCTAAVKACGAGPDAIAVDSFLPRIAPAPAG